MTNQFRFGGDVRGLYNNLDYIQGLGMKVGHHTFRKSGVILTISRVYT